MKNKEKIPLAVDTLPNPLGNRILVKVLKTENKSTIILLNPKEQSYAKAEVVTVSSKIKELKIGDIILHSKYGAERFVFKNEEYLIMHENDVFAIIQ